MSPGITRKSNQQTRMNGALLWFVELTDDYQDLRGLWRTWVVKFEIGEVWGIPLPVNNMILGTSYQRRTRPRSRGETRLQVVPSELIVVLNIGLSNYSRNSVE